MYYCQDCGRLISEKDIDFENKINHKRKNHRCIECRQAGYYDCTFFSSLNVSILSYIILAIGSVVFSSLPFFIIYAALSQKTLPDILGVLLIGLHFGAIITVIDIRGNSGGKFYKTGSHYESSISGNTVTTKEVAEYSDGGEGMLKFFLIIVFPVWCFSYFTYVTCKSIRAVSNFKKEVPKFIRDAYRESKIFPQVISWKYIDEYNKRKVAYNDNVGRIKSKYSVLDEDEIEDKINKLEKPCFYFEYNDIKYIEVEEKKICTSTRNKITYDVKFLVYRNIDGSIKGKICDGKYFIYSDNNDWKQDWNDLEPKTSADTAVEKYGHLV